MLHVQVITPERIVLDEKEIQEVIVPTTTGEITILPSHIPLITQVAPGELILKKKEGTEHFVVIGGFLEVTPSSVTLLADYAVHGREISTLKAREAKDRAEKALREKLTEEDFATAQAELRKAILQLKVAGKVRKTA